ncbi:LTA synthase family protein [Parabacteroides faecis]|uniref:LTA synthase family protein n=1 Tax=Parabacteroides TaxID=375288 RepID=UPI000EFFD0B4|nr:MULTISPECIES: LTA synthase family protein [Parabacteroides]MBC8619568.1 LTA synthase family protein [Parabacteroides faecis]RHR97584.1 LTA synthase family protein [Parabacteroides sp. AF14-59]
MKKRLLFLLTVFFCWLPILAIQKPVFMLYHHALANECSLIDYLKVITHGLLLDCTVSGYLTVIPLLCILVSVWLPGTFYQKFIKGYFLATGLLVAAIFAVDVALYGYWGFRLDATLFFYLQSPTDAMASVPIGTFFLQFLLFLIYAYGIYWVFKRFVVPLFPTTPTHNRLGGTIVILLLGGILFIPIRGGVTTSTANVGMVYFSKNQFLNHSAINPAFSLLASLSKQQDFAAQFDFFPEEERKERYAALTAHNNLPMNDVDTEKLLTTDRPNILIILMESFTANVIEAVGGEVGITPNLNRLSREGVTFTNMYANSFRTDRGIVAVLNGYLAQPTTSIMKYPAKSQTLPSIAKSLGEQGYTADMLYGGDINFTNMQSYFFSSGYSQITADRDFPLSSRLSKWGANDDITFTHLYESIKDRDEKAPWLSTFLTLSSHEPFEVPYHHLEDPYLNSVAFTDSCIGSFVDKLKELPVWKNTLIVLVSDHGYRYPSSLTDYEPRRFHIPMIWLGGAVKEPTVIETYANQTDLAATLLSQLGLPHDQFIFSRDILAPGYPEYSFYTFTNGFGFIDSTGVSVYDNESNKPLIENPAAGSEERLNRGKVLLQTLYDDLGNR